MKKRILALVLVLCTLLSLSACSQTGEENIQFTREPPKETVSEEPAMEATPEPESTVEMVSAEEPEMIEVSYPLTEEEIALSYMNREYPLVTSYLENEDWNNHLLLQKAEEITGVKIDYIPVAAFNTGEVYALSYASDDLADMYYWGVFQYSKGADGAIEDDIFFR